MANLLWLVPFAVAGIGSIIAYVALTQGVPAAVTMVKSWWNKGKADVAAIQADVASAKAEIQTIKQKIGLS